MLAEAGIDAAGREPRTGPGGEGRGAPRRLPLALHRPAPEPQGQGRLPVRGADPLRRLGLRAAQARAAPHAGDAGAGGGRRRGRGGQGRHRPGRARRVHRALPRACRGPDDDAAPSPTIPKPAARTSRRCGSSRASTACASSRWAPRRTTRSRPRRARPSCGSARRLFPSLRIVAGNSGVPRTRTRHGLQRHLAPHARLLRPRRGPRRVRRLEEPDPRDSEAELESRYRERPNVRRLQSRRRRDEIDDIFADDAPSERRTVLRPRRGGSAGSSRRRDRPTAATCACTS